MLELTKSTDILSLFETNKAQRQDFIDQTVQAIENGLVDPLKIHLQVKAAEDIIKGLAGDKSYKESLLTEAGKHGKTFEMHSAEFSVKEVGTKYDYSECGDPKLNQMEAELLELSEKIKARKKFLNNIPEGGFTELNEETGEAITLYKPVKSSTTSVTVKLK